MNPNPMQEYNSIYLAREPLSGFEQYVQQSEVDLAADGVGYRQFPLHLSDEELTEFLGSMNELIAHGAMMSRRGRRASCSRHRARSGRWGPALACSSASLRA
jgi:hypothetical protein